MIKLENLNKYYNKNKSSEYHVINDISYEFSETGLYSIFGPSGCGKTTLLNVIGGLDNFDSGSITYENQSFSHYTPRKADEIRNEIIGYIFQNYNLIDNLNVSENVESVLKIIGINDKEEIKKRVEECLKAVGLYKFRKRNVLALSGGQRQRVAIARALAKNPTVILADEPTGNLDSNNTFEVMNIIKRISKDRLVILVSHEKDLVDFYSDRIIELKDGKIVNEIINNGEKSLKHNDVRNIYLKDYKARKIDDNSLSFNVYSNDDLDNVTFDIVFRNGEIYLKNNSTMKIHVVDETSETKFIDKTLEEHKRDTSTYESSFDFSNFDETKKQKKNKYGLFKSIANGFKSTTFVKKNVFTSIVLIIVGLALAFNICSIFATFKVTPKEYIEAPSSCVRVEITNKDLRNGLNALTLIDHLDGDSNIEGMMGNLDGSRHALAFDYRRFYNTKNDYSGKTSFNVFMCLNEGKDYTLLEGKGCEDKNDVVISKWIADDILAYSSAESNGYHTYSDLIGEPCGLFTSIYNSYERSDNGFKISGIAKIDDPSIFVKEESYIKIDKALYSEQETVYIATKSKDLTIEKLENLGYSDVSDPNYHAKINCIKDKITSQLWLFIFFGVIIFALLLYLMLINRSQMFKRIKEIGTIRSIGYKRKDIVSIYFGEAFAQATKTSIIAFTATFLFILYLKKNFNMNDLGIEIFNTGLLPYITGIFFIYFINIVSTIIPVSLLLTKSPVEIIKKYDI